jgi:predicted metalloendopeptidase
LQDPDSTPERWRTCVGHVDDGLGWILSRFFVEKAFSEKAKIFGDQIVSDIKEMFIEKLKKTTWMDKSVVELAIEKVHKIVQKIGYPTKVRSAFILVRKILTFIRALISWIQQVCSVTINLSTLLPPPSSKIHFL